MTADAVSLREHFEALLREKDLRDQQRFEAQSKAVDYALTAAEKAVVKAEIAANKRFESVNEFRDAYKDIIVQQMPRAEAEQRISALAEKLGELQKTAAKQQADTSAMRARSAAYTAGLAAAVTVMTVVMALLTFVARR